MTQPSRNSQIVIRRAINPSTYVIRYWKKRQCLHYVFYAVLNLFQSSTIAPRQDRHSVHPSHQRWESTRHSIIVCGRNTQLVSSSSSTI